MNGIDRSTDYVAYTRESIRDGRVGFQVGDAQALPIANAACDAVVSGFLLRNVVDLPGSLREQRRVHAGDDRRLCIEGDPIRRDVVGVFDAKAGIRQMEFILDPLVKLQHFEPARMHHDLKPCARSVREKALERINAEDADAFGDAADHAGGEVGGGDGGSSEEIFKLLPVLDRYPLAQIVIHPRTARQMYGGRPDLDAFERCLALSRHRIAYNGDIVHVAGFKELQARFPAVDEWMIGRGALTDPFLPAAIKTGADPGPDRVRRFKAFYDDLFDRTRVRLSGPGHLLARMKGYWTYFAAAFTDGERLAKQIHRTFQLPRYIDTVERFFQAEAVWREK